ncbi:unnamed protein product [Ectocarpus sp. 8 AP-2014]
MTHNVRRFRIGLPSEEHVMGMKTASCIVVKGKGKDGSVAVRPYTPTTTNDTKGHFDLVIKVYPEGNVSSHLFSLKVGDMVTVKGPFPKFDYSPNVKKEIGMISGGTGITPMLQVLQELLLNPEDKTKVTLLFANVTAADIMLKAEIDKLAAEHDNFDVVYIVDKAEEGWTGPTGHVNASLIETHLPKPSEDSVIFVCGPPGMMNAISGPKNEDKSQGEIGGVLKGLGYTSDMVYKF